MTKTEIGNATRKKSAVLVEIVYVIFTAALNPITSGIKTEIGSAMRTKFV
jgi:hypothetical protein